MQVMMAQFSYGISPRILAQTPWDVNADGVVNILDLTFVASRFGESSPDLNGDGIVNILDFNTHHTTGWKIGG